ncbi:Imm45 family immunity protein [Chromobacterium vaccinii]|uniref:Imm45 family immunity protein n=1 Tax=Chromobacterium vaccinii TaxID=1108595 RepID=UPI000E1FD72E|nr:Imm45 family immunity protein [Chromobacterium vaccinii]
MAGNPVILVVAGLKSVDLLQPKPPREIAFLFARQVVQTFLNGDWKKLIDFDSEFLLCGDVFRVPSEKKYDGAWYAEDITDFMFVNAACFDSVLALIAISGHHAGELFYHFPRDAFCLKHGGLDKQWLLSNWNAWIYPDGVISNVWVRNHALLTGCQMARWVSGDNWDLLIGL